jgi:ribosomal-protein-alanine N-acetyltransferase
VPLELRAGDERDWPRFHELVALSPEAAGWVDLYPSLVAEQDGIIVGFALYRLVAGEGELLNLAVDPKQRRSGVGRELLEHLFGMVDVWHLEVRESNAGAISLYQATGFVQVGRRTGYYSDGETALLFSGSLRKP